MIRAPSHPAILSVNHSNPVNRNRHCIRPGVASLISLLFFQQCYTFEPLHCMFVLLSASNPWTIRTQWTTAWFEPNTFIWSMSSTRDSNRDDVSLKLQFSLLCFILPQTLSNNSSNNWCATESTPSTESVPLSYPHLKCILGLLLKQWKHQVYDHYASPESLHRSCELLFSSKVNYISCIFWLGSKKEFDTSFSCIRSVDSTLVVESPSSLYVNCWNSCGLNLQLQNRTNSWLCNQISHGPLLNLLGCSTWFIIHIITVHHRFKW